MREFALKLRCLFLLLLINTTCVSADTYIIGAQNIKYYPHYDFTAENDKGLGWAILEAFAQHSGHTFVYLSMPVRRLQMEMLKGNVDFVYPDNSRWYNQITKAEEKVFSAPLTATLSVTLSKPSLVGKGIDAVTHLGVPFGFTPVAWLQRINNNAIKITALDDVYTGLSLLNTGRINAMDIEYFVSKIVVDRHPSLGKFAVDLTLPNNIVNFHLSTIKHETLLNELNTFLAENAPLIDDIKEQYGVHAITEVIGSFRERQGINENEIWSAL